MALALSLGVAGQAADIAGEGVAHSLLGVAQVFAETARNARVNRQAVSALSSRVQDWIAVICTQFENTAMPSPSTSDDWIQGLRAFESAVVEAQKDLEGLQHRTYLAQILSQERDAGRIKDISEKLQHAFDALVVRSRIQQHQLVADIARTLRAGRALEELRAVETDLSERAGMHAASLPSRPQLFFGRGSETQKVLDALVSTTAAHVAVLGGPGMGKTSLALNVLHEPSIAGRFGERRYFVPCDSADASIDTIRVIGNAFGLSSSSRTTIEKGLRTSLDLTLPTLLVLDNFESAWEALDRRAESEQVLELLSGFEHLSIMVTLRGMERPSGANWAKPFLPPLEPLGRLDARQTFLAIADVSDNDSAFEQLLDQLEDLPLAIVLMANLAQTESLVSLVARWEDLSTALLTRNDSSHRLSSLDASIQLSLDSPRMKQSPEAASLLSLLALLPDGIKDSDVPLCAAGLRSPSRALSTLLQCALAYRSTEERIRVLAPIRQYILAHHPPTAAILGPLYDYAFGMAAVVRQGDEAFSFDLVSAMRPEVANIAYVARYSLLNNGNPADALGAMDSLCLLYLHTGIGSADLIPFSLACARSHNLPRQTADMLYRLGWVRFDSTSDDELAAWFREAAVLYEQVGNIDGAIRAYASLCYSLDGDEALKVVDHVLPWLDGCDDPVRAARILECCTFAYGQCGTRHLDDIRRCHARIIELLDNVNTHPALVGKSMYWLGEDDIDQGHTVRGIHRLRQAAEIFRAAHTTRNLADVSMSLGVALLAEGHAQESIGHLLTVYEGFRAVGRTYPQINALARLSRAALDCDDEAAAVDYLRRAEEDLRNAPPTYKLPIYSGGQLLRVHGEIALWRGDLSEARVVLRGALAACRESKETDTKALEARCLELSGNVEQSDGQPSAAATYFLTAACIYRKLGVGPQIARVVAALANVVDDAPAESLLQAVLLPLMRYSMLRVLGDALLCSAQLALQREQRLLAQHRARSALKHFESTNDQRGIERATAFMNVV
ncbi:hypothetical protein EXIGLDRAFT_762888 [Exidia glandulosa HHB12029]|uniref:Novel STAND NTPase 1 domain-containing protein n=1 Tax=Exidia glandulosa HHB12029 TaxID=1314781 RepID=A0A165MDT8_EXIGL|nr:hypothetical protein EXIGLDRAFT_762888 [Exidia glandulosa HHB12029]